MTEEKKEPVGPDESSPKTSEANGKELEQLIKEDPANPQTNPELDQPIAEGTGERPVEDDAEAKVKAAAEARAARAAARAAKEAAEAEDAPKEPSPNQPKLDRAVELLKAQVSPEAIEEAWINERDGHRPYLYIKPEEWPACAEILKNHEEFRFDYLRNVSGVDRETHMEVAYFLQSLATMDEICIKVKTDRNEPSVPSATPLWATANWNEREIFDLLGVDFPGHPNLVRIMMPDDWVGHPLRKDYQPLDPEV